ncbi:hypothetical protein COOONC_27949 [Cooperia oncophora]
MRPNGPDYETEINDQYVTVKMLMEEVYTKSCECRLWALVRLTAGLLNKRLEELGKAVTHLLVRQKQITVCCLYVYITMFLCDDGMAAYVLNLSKANK